MIKELKELYPLVYEEALKNQEEQGNKRNDEKFLCNDSNKGNFNWDETKERFDFWHQINNRNYSYASKICPHLFNTTLTYELWV